MSDTYSEGWDAAIPWDSEIAWYLREAAGALGEQGFQPSDGGTDGALTSSDPYHESFMLRIPHATRARRCDTVWREMEGYSRRVLTSHYHTRRWWPQGTEAQLGSGLVGATLGSLSSEGRLQLLQACLSASNKESERIIKAAKARALEDLRYAHLQWSTLWRATRPKKTHTQQKVDAFATSLGV